MPATSAKNPHMTVLVLAVKQGKKVKAGIEAKKIAKNLSTRKMREFAPRQKQMRVVTQQSHA